MNEKTDVQKHNIQSVILIAVFALLFILVALLLKPFFTVILWAAILYVFLNPLYERVAGTRRAAMLGKKPNAFRRSAAGGLFAVGSVLLIIVPIGLLGYQILKQSGQLLNEVIAFSRDPNGPFSGEAGMRHFLSGLSGGLLGEKSYATIRDWLLQSSSGKIDLASLNLSEIVTALLRANQKALIAFSTQTARGLGSFILSLAFIIFTLYFFFTDGRYLLSLFTKAIPIKNEYMASFVKRFRDTTRQLVLGNIGVSLIQGCIAFVLFTVFGVKGSLLLAFLVSVCSFIPMIGAGTIWLPVALSYILFRSPGWGLLLLGLSAGLISLLDNFYRPFMVGGPIQIHPLPIFYAIIGGLTLFGINGLIIGPLILALFLSAIDIFRASFSLPRDGGEEGDLKRGANGGQGRA